MMAEVVIAIVMVKGRRVILNSLCKRMTQCQSEFPFFNFKTNSDNVIEIGLNSLGYVELVKMVESVIVSKVAA